MTAETAVREGDADASLERVGRAMVGERALDGGSSRQRGGIFRVQSLKYIIPEESGLTESKDVRESTEAKEIAQGREFNMTRRDPSSQVGTEQEGGGPET